jgi:hypothetical protein
MPVEVLRLKVSKECFEQIDSGKTKGLLIKSDDEENLSKIIDEEALAKEFYSKDLDPNTLCKELVARHIRKFDFAIISCDGEEDTIRLNNPNVSISGNCYLIEFSDKVLVSQEFYQRSIIRCATCRNEMDVYRSKFPICDDCLKVLREIIKERRLEKEMK